MNSRVAGVGIDLVERSRFQRELERYPSLQDTLFTPGESRLVAATSQGACAAFAIKEAVFKALGESWTGGRLDWREIEVLEKDGLYKAFFRGAVGDLTESRGICSSVVEVDVTPERTRATVILLREKGGGNRCPPA